MAKTNYQKLMDRVKVLEERVRALEARPLTIINMPAAPAPLAPYWIPIPTWPSWPQYDIICDSGLSQLGNPDSLDTATNIGTVINAGAANVTS